MAGSGGDRHDRLDRIGGVRAWAVWLVVTAFVVWTFAIQTAYAIVSQEIQVDAGLRLSQIGIAATVYTWVFAVAQLVSGPLLDRFGTRPLIQVAIALVAVGAWLYSTTSGFATLALAQVVLAVGASFAFVGAGFVGGEWFAPARYGLMFALAQACSSLGSAVAQPVILFVLGLVDWRGLLLVFALVGVVLVALAAFVVRDPRGADDRSRRTGLVRGILAGLARSFRDRNVVLCGVVAGASFGGLLAVGTLWAPRILEAKGVEPDAAALMTGLVWLGAAIGAPVYSVIAGRLGARRPTILVGLALQIAAIAAVLYLPPGPVWLEAALMAGFGLVSGVQILAFALAGESVPRSYRGGATAVVNGIAFLAAGALTSLPGGMLPDAPSLADFRVALVLLPAVLVAGFAAAWWLREPRRRAS